MYNVDNRYYIILHDINDSQCGINFVNQHFNKSPAYRIISDFYLSRETIKVPLIIKLFIPFNLLFYNKLGKY